jgi:large subunit ribosomal protein L24
MATHAVRTKNLKKTRGQRVSDKKRFHKIAEFSTSLKIGDTVMVLTGGNSLKNKSLEGKTGKILKFLKSKNRVIVSGLNLVSRHMRAGGMQEKAGIIKKEGSIHISNVMYYAESLKRPVRLKAKILDTGDKVRGYTDPKTKKFVELGV